MLMRALGLAVTAESTTPQGRVSRADSRQYGGVLEAVMQKRSWASARGIHQLWVESFAYMICPVAAAAAAAAVPLCRVPTSGLQP
jgi:hypothetical protein